MKQYGSRCQNEKQALDKGTWCRTQRQMFENESYSNQVPVTLASLPELPSRPTELQTSLHVVLSTGHLEVAYVCDQPDSAVFSIATLFYLGKLAT